MTEIKSNADIEPEITAMVAVSYSGHTYAEGKKAGWRDGCRALWCIVKYNFLR